MLARSLWPSFRLYRRYEARPLEAPAIFGGPSRKETGHRVSRETELGRSYRRLPPCLSPEIGRQNSERRRGQAVEPTRLPDRSRPRRFKLRARLVGEPEHRTVID